MTSVSSARQGVEMIEIDAELAGQRIDNFLFARLKGVPKSRVYRLLREGEVRVNKGRVRPAYRLADHDLVRIPPLRIAAPGPAAAPGAQLRDVLRARILFENEQLLVLDKPAG